MIKTNKTITNVIRGVKWTSTWLLVGINLNRQARLTLTVIVWLGSIFFYIENIIISSLYLFGSHTRRQARNLCESTEKFATQFIVGLDKSTID